MKTTIKTYLHCQPATSYNSNIINGFSLSLIGCDDMVSVGYTLIKPVEVEVELPDDWNPALAVVETLQAKKRELMAEFQARCMSIEAEINKLTAITFDEVRV